MWVHPYSFTGTDGGWDSQSGRDGKYITVLFQDHTSGEIVKVVWHLRLLKKEGVAGEGETAQGLEPKVTASLLSDLRECGLGMDYCCHDASQSVLKVHSGRGGG